MELPREDLKYLESKGLCPKGVCEQVQKIKKGSKPLKLEFPATLNRGITVFTDKEEKTLINLYDSMAGKFVMTSFIPASGAASRMFLVLGKTVEQFPEEFDLFIRGLEEKKFAFYNSLKNIMAKDNLSLGEEIRKKRYNKIIEYLLLKKGLNYSSIPKGLIEFHRYGDFSRTAFTEHLAENSMVLTSNPKNYLHFTINSRFKQDFSRQLKKYKKQIKHTDFLRVEFSEQRESTNTIALDENNRIFRDKNNFPLLRPGGHGALIVNMNELNSDIIFIKNIDNIVHDRFKDIVVRSKKILAGYFLKIQGELFSYLKTLLQKNVSPEQIKLIYDFARQVLNIDFVSNFFKQSSALQQKNLLSRLNRPLRICGMVKNSGEAGGGPFFIKRNDSLLSLQIVEDAQIDKSSAKQREALKNSTHFNPVDLVCGVKDFLGRKFNLTEFVDEEVYFVAEKYQDGKLLKVLELPGLWNGAMARWNTVFIEVDAGTFNPVKTVNDLLRPKHQEQTVD